MRFSIVMPVYNVEKYLKESVESVLSQSFQDYELILVDDGSTDSSSDMCDGFQCQYSQIKVIHKTNGGLSDARNVGLSYTSGEYIIFLDSDDYWNDKDFLLKADKLIVDKYPQVIVFGYKKVLDEREISIYSPVSNSKDISELVEASEFNICAWDKIIERKLLVNHSIQFRKNVYSEDMEWCALIFKYTDRVSVMKESPYSYRQREGSITKTISEKNIADIKYNFEKCKEIIKELPLNKKDVYESYLSKNISMFIIALSNIDKKKQREYYSFVKENKGFLRRYTRNREKILYLSISILGITLTEKLLSVVCRMKG